jgi:protein gp37
VWFGTSVEDQQRADERIPELLKIPARVRFLSVEPLLEKIDFTYSCFNGADSLRTMPGIHWVIFGGESGRGARPCNIEWIRDGVRQCRAAGVKPFVKQMGSFSIEEQGSQRRRILWDDSKGGDPSEWPEDLRVREFPKQEQHA